MHLLNDVMGIFSNQERRQEYIQDVLVSVNRENSPHAPIISESGVTLAEMSQARTQR